MKKLTLILLVIALFVITGCEDHRMKKPYLPEAKNDKIYAVIGGADKPTDIKVTDGKNEKADEAYTGEGYTINIPNEGYRFEKDFDDGALEEKWDYTKRDDVELKVTTYKNTDEVTARGRFLRDNEGYTFEDMTGYPICGQEFDGDTLWFNIHVSGETVYIVSWEFPKNTSEDLQKELSNIAGTFKLAEE